MTINRLNYSTGQLLTADDFKDEQFYHVDMRRRVNSALMTQGVVSGLQLNPKSETEFTVSPGWAIDKYGREIVLTAEIDIDLSNPAVRTAHGLTDAQIVGSGWVAVTLAYSDGPDPAHTLNIGSPNVSARTLEQPVLTLQKLADGFQGSSVNVVQPVDGVNIWLGAYYFDKDGPYTRYFGAYPFNRETSLAQHSDGNLPQLAVSGPASLGSGLKLKGQLELSSASTSGSTPKLESRDDGTLRVSTYPDSQKKFPPIHLNPQNVSTGAGPDGYRFGSVGIGQNNDPLGRLHIGGPKGGSQTGNPNSPTFTKIAAALVTDSLLTVGDLVNDTAPANFTPKTASVFGDLAITGNLSVGGMKTGYVVDQFVNRVGEGLELGDVVVIDKTQPAFHYGLHDYIPVPEVDLARSAYDSSVCGIVCSVHGEMVEVGVTSSKSKAKKTKGAATEKSTAAKHEARVFDANEMTDRDHTRIEHGQIGNMVTLGAFAHCKVDADIAPIVAGDLLTTSPTPGHAQKVLDRSQAIGAIVGKALAPMKKGKGTIPVMVMMQ